MGAKISYDELLKTVLDRVVQNNQQLRPGTPLSDLKNAIESALGSLPQLEFGEFSKVLDNKDSVEQLLERAPQIIGWNADQIVKWVEEISKKVK
jgi:hypothetical protein